MLHRVANLRPGMTLLVHMAAGGVGLAAIALARAGGGVEIFGTASASKHAVLREAGVQHPIDYRTQDHVVEVKRSRRGAGSTWCSTRSVAPSGPGDTSVLAPVGHLVCFGWANATSGESRNLLKVAGGLATMKRWNALDLMSRNITVSGVNVGHLWGETEIVRATLDALLLLWREGKVKSAHRPGVPAGRGARRAPTDARAEERREDPLRLRSSASSGADSASASASRPGSSGLPMNRSAPMPLHRRAVAAVERAEMPISDRVGKALPEPGDELHAASPGRETSTTAMSRAPACSSRASASSALPTATVR